jgi:hypothetical protein
VASHHPDYEQRCTAAKRVAPRRRLVGWSIAVLSLALAFAVALPFLANAYTGVMYKGIQMGMTRAQVDRHLWAFARHTNTRSGLAPGGYAIDYELLGLGKQTTIVVFFRNDGTSVGLMPAFIN